VAAVSGGGFAWGVPEFVVATGLQGCSKAQNAFGAAVRPVSHAGLFAAKPDQVFASALDLATADPQAELPVTGVVDALAIVFQVADQLPQGFPFTLDTDRFSQVSQRAKRIVHTSIPELVKPRLAELFCF
jgi:hypothetical protein